jgi:tetratricopeptide (TPR) repeat protein
VSILCAPPVTDKIEESDNMEGWYLLGRASLVLTQLELSYQNGYEAYQNGYEAYQEAVYCNPHCAPLWTSIGILFFQVNQARDCLGCFSRSIRLHPYDDLVWRNLGVLVSTLVGQVPDHKSDRFLSTITATKYTTHWMLMSVRWTLMMCTTIAGFE